MKILTIFLFISLQLFQASAEAAGRKTRCQTSLDDVSDQTIDLERSLVREEKQLVMLVRDSLMRDLRLPTAAQLTEAGLTFDSDANLLQRGLAAYPALVKTISIRLTDAVAKIAAQTQHLPPNMAELAQELGLTEAELAVLVGKNGVFDDITALKERAKAERPKAFATIIDRDLIPEARDHELDEKIRTGSGVVLTTYVAGQSVNSESLQLLRSFAKKNNSPLVIYPSFGQYGSLPAELLGLPDVYILTNTLILNRHWSINGIPIMPKQVSPLMGIESLGERGQSQVIFNPQFVVKGVPTGDNMNVPHKLFSTGAISEPEYWANLPIGWRMDAKAREAHRVGALYLVKTPGQKGMEMLGGAGDYTDRHIEVVAGPGGQRHLHDLGRVYSVDGKVKNVEIEALVVGDLHAAAADPHAVYALQEQVLGLGGLNYPAGRKPKIKRIVLHDARDGTAVNHWERQNAIVRARRDAQGQLDFDRESQSVVSYANALHQLHPEAEIIFAYDNHGSEWTYRWLADGGFIDDAQNTARGAELLAAAIRRGKEPLIYALEMAGFDHPNRITFLGPGESYRVGNREGGLGIHGVEIGQHGQLSGRRSLGVKSQLQGYGASVVGHYHVYERMLNAIRVGALTPPRQGYGMLGPSGTDQSCALVYSDESIQGLEFRQGWWVPDGQPVLPADQFFEKGLPRRVVPVRPSTPSVDQYRVVNPEVRQGGGR